MNNDIKKLLETPMGKGLKNFLLGHYLKLKNIEGIETLTELKAQQKAAKIIEGILSEIMDMKVEMKPKKLEDQFYNL